MKVVRARAKSSLGEMHGPDGHEDAGSGRKDFAVDEGRGGCGADGGCRAGEAEDFVERGLETRAFAEEVACVDVDGGGGGGVLAAERGADFGEDLRLKGGCGEDVGEEPECKLPGAAVHPVVQDERRVVSRVLTGNGRLGGQGQATGKHIRPIQQESGVCNFFVVKRFFALLRFHGLHKWCGITSAINWCSEVCVEGVKDFSLGNIRRR